MYRIIKTDGTVIGTVDKPIYIKRGENGCYIDATDKDATGVAYQSEPYNLAGCSDVEGAETVTVSEFNGAAVVAEQQDVIDELLISALEG